MNSTSPPDRAATAIRKGLLLGWVVVLTSACGREGAGRRPGPPPADRGEGPVVVLIAWHSNTGNTEELAAAVAQGAAAVEGTRVIARPIAEVTGDDLQSADGLVLGCPTHFANIPGEMKVVLDRWAAELRIDFRDKVGGAFATGGNLTGGKEHVVVSLLLYMLNNRMMVLGPIYRDGPEGWGEIGATAATGDDDPGLSDAELEGGRRLGDRVARAAARLAGGS